MSLPSSPPLLPEQDLPTSSFLPPHASALDISAGHDALTRKRQLSDYASGSLSSDPLFSDGTSDGDASQYGSDQPRKKKLVRGPWWNLQRSGIKSLRQGIVKKEGKRNADSGVWMGSDESQESIDSIVSGQQRLQELAMDDIAEEEPKSDDTVPDSETLAERIVNGCVDRGTERVDLSDLGLTSVSSATLRPLHQLIRQSFADFTHPPSEDEFGPLTPSIQLYLSRNQLTSLPAELFTLTNITVLSLRNNDLGYLPPAIGRLHKLTELNIAGNGMRHLPWELLDVLHCKGKHRQIAVRPNPFIEPCDLSGPSPLPKAGSHRRVSSEELSRWADTEDTINNLRKEYEEDGALSMRAELELRLKMGRMLRIQYLQEASRIGKELQLCREELIYLASSAVRYFGVDGKPVRRLGALQPEEEDFAAVVDPTANAPPALGSTSASSLFELALRKLQKDFNLQEALPQLASYGVSSSLSSAIQRAASNVSATGYGNESCSTCGKEYIIPRAEWMEYWYHGFSSQQHLSPESVLPFLRKACSWACARPTEMGEFRC